MKRETKEIVAAISEFVLFYGLGVVTYYSGHPQIGEGIAMVSCIGLALWGFGFAAVHTPTTESC